MVTNALSASPGGTLITKAGRTLAAYPRSTSQISPRVAGILLLVSVKLLEQLVSDVR